MSAPRGKRAAMIAAPLIVTGYLAWQVHAWSRERPGVSERPPAARAAAPRAEHAIRFTDGTSAVRLRFRHDRASSGRRYFVETMGAGAAFIDYDDDGDQDLFFVNGGPLPGYRLRGPLLPALYRNDGGALKDVTRAAGLAVQMYGMGCAVGDFDNDGHDDLYVTAVLGPSRLFRNRGDGRFVDVTAAAGVENRGRFGTSAAWLDYDRDGDLDLYIANYVRYNSVADDLPCYFKDRVRSYCIPFAYQAEGNRLYRNEGSGRFSDVSRQAGVDAPGKSLAVAVGDYDADGWPDLFVANDTTPTQLFRNNRNGAFSEVAPQAAIAYGPTGTAKAGMGVDLADPWNDGGLAVAMGNFSAEMVGYYERTPSGYFEERSILAGLGHPSRKFLTFGTVFADVDNDGWKDLILANGHVQDNVELFYDDISYRQRPLLFRNLAAHRYEEVGLTAGPAFATRLVGRGLARGDLDGDGRLDLVITENNGPARFWRNASRGGHWIMVRLRGRRSNRNGFGARLIATAGTLRQTTELQSGSSYLSQSDQRVHFGLGAAARLDRLEIRWPSGVVDVLTGLEADRVLTVEEGAHPDAGAG